MQELEKANILIVQKPDYVKYVCPNCNMAIGAMGDREEHHFCLNCGQKLKWEE